MKKVVVTGASRGIGYAIAKRFLEEGNTVCLCSRNAKSLENAVESLEREVPNAKIFFRTTDLRNKEDVKEFANFALKNLGVVDILINNAGSFIPGQIHTEADGTLEELIASNVYSAYYLSKALIPNMIERKQGHIINMCSTASIMSYINGGSYCISKHALLGMSRTLRAELMEFNIKVTAVMPGATYTESWANVGLPESRFMSTSDVADCIYLATNLSKGGVMEEIILRPMEGDI